MVRESQLNDRSFSGLPIPTYYLLGVSEPVRPKLSWMICQGGEGNTWTRTMNCGVVEIIEINRRLRMRSIESLVYSLWPSSVAAAANHQVT